MTQKIMFQFPGQGSQAVGMGGSLAEAFPAARAVFEEVNDAPVSYTHLTLPTKA